MPEVVHFRFENPPEALHKAVVDAAAGPGHTLRCMDTVQLCFELPVGVLIASVAVKQRMGAGVGAHRPVKGVKDKLIVVGSAQRIRNDAFVMEIKDRFSALFGYPKQLEDLGLDCVILAPSMLEPMPEDLPAEDGRLLSLTCFYDSDSGCAAQTLALSSDMGLLLRKMREDLDTYEIPVILSHVERRIDGYQFSYEAKDAEVEGLYLSYTISGVPVFLSQPAGHNCAAQE